MLELVIATVVIISVEVASTAETAVVVTVMTKKGMEVSTDGTGAVIIAPVGTSDREVNVRISMEVTGPTSGLDGNRVGATLVGTSVKLIKVILSTSELTEGLNDDGVLMIML